MKPTVIAALSALSLVGTGAAYAQSASPIPTPFKNYTIKGGVFFPSNPRTRRDTDSYFYSMGITYDFLKPRIPVVGGALPTVTGELFGDVVTAVSEGTWVNIGVAGRVSFGAASPFYLGAGIGGAYFNTRFPSDNRQHKDTYKATAKAFLGFSLPVGFFLEGEYTRFGTVRGLDLDGVNLRVGYRF